MVSSNIASCSWASSKVEPDNTVFLNDTPWRLAFPKLTRSRTAFEKSTPAHNLNYNVKIYTYRGTLYTFALSETLCGILNFLDLESSVIRTA